MAFEIKQALIKGEFPSGCTQCKFINFPEGSWSQYWCFLTGKGIDEDQGLHLRFERMFDCPLVFEIKPSVSLFQKIINVMKDIFHSKNNMEN